MKKDLHFEQLNNKLLACLDARDPNATKVISELKKLGVERGDNDIIGYAYYRYAYYYYFTAQDINKLRKYLQKAIKYLLRSDNKEFLGAAYNLVAYDAQDQGSFDIAYAYYMIAVKTLKGVDGIPLPALIMSSAGRLLTELGKPKQGLKKLKDSAAKLIKFEDMHVFNYNMISTYEDVSLASFLLGDADEVAMARDKIEYYFNNADADEKELCRSHYLLSQIYHALLTADDKVLEEKVAELSDHWTRIPDGDFISLMFEIETLISFMLSHDYISQTADILKRVTILEEDENSGIAIRYYNLKIKYYEKIQDQNKLRESLRIQHELRKRQKAEATRMKRYSMEFADMLESITEEGERVKEENLHLQIQANTDALTGLPNRNAMNSVLPARFEKAAEDKTGFGIGIIDVDRFKQYNDEFGHQEGDRCLKTIGKALLKFNSRPELFCTRYGGDEFVVAYFDLSDEEIEKIAEEMKQTVSKATKRMRKKHVDEICISQGVYNSVPDGTKKLWDYLTLADQQLYRIKQKQ